MPAHVAFLIYFFKGRLYQTQSSCSYHRMVLLISLFWSYIISSYNKFVVILFLKQSLITVITMTVIFTIIRTLYLASSWFVFMMNVWFVENVMFQINNAFEMKMYNVVALGVLNFKFYILWRYFNPLLQIMENYSTSIWRIHYYKLLRVMIFS